MSWAVGVDEAGYGPNLGPFVMSSVACRLPDERVGADLWHVLAAAVRRADGEPDHRLVVDDSKAVYSPARGLAPLERGVLACLNKGSGVFSENKGACPLFQLGDLTAAACSDCVPDLHQEPWYRGDWPVPAAVSIDDLGPPTELFGQCCVEAGDLRWLMRSVVVCPRRFNAIAGAAGSKGAVLAEGLGRLLRWNLAHLPGDEALSFAIDKHGGRNAYAASVQQGLSAGAVVARQESAAQSIYEIVGLDREVRLSFRPRADRYDFCVALASMISKYLRELFMLEFNRFWEEQVPGLKPTAGYPGDSARYLDAIQPVVDRLGLDLEHVWRQR
jgi:hypothetical protein